MIPTHVSKSRIKTDSEIKSKKFWLKIKLIYTVIIILFKFLAFVSSLITTYLVWYYKYTEKTPAEIIIGPVSAAEIIIISGGINAVYSVISENNILLNRSEKN